MKTLPKDFTNFPYDSILQHTESEIVAQNIMIILKRTGNKFRPISPEEYTTERLKDGGWSPLENAEFEKVRTYCESAESAKKFSPQWKDAGE